MKERNIKMSLETARELYNHYKECDGVNIVATTSGRAVYESIIQAFTKQELEGKKGYTWEEAFSGCGYYLDDENQIQRTSSKVVFPPTEMHHNLARTKAQIKSVKAFIMLTHIVAKANEGKGFDGYYHTVCVGNNRLEARSLVYTRSQLEFCDREDALISMVENKDLWNEYHMIERK